MCDVKVGESSLVICLEVRCLPADAGVVFMTRLLTLSLVAACAFVASAAPQQPVFRGTSDAVRVFVTVTDKDGRLIPGLKQEDFEIKDEGKPQPITLFDNSPQPVRLVAMLDVSGSMEGQPAAAARRLRAVVHAARPE